MEYIPFTHLPEIREETFLYLPYDDIMSMCRTHPDLSYICSDNRFWKRKVRHDFHVERFKPEEISYRQQYKDLITYTKPNKAAKEGRLDILIVLEEELDILPNAIGASSAAGNGHLHILKWLEERDILPSDGGANWAATHGRLHILKWLKKTA